MAAVRLVSMYWDNSTAARRAAAAYIVAYLAFTDPSCMLLATLSGHLGFQHDTMMGHCAPSLWHRFQRGVYSG